MGRVSKALHKMRIIAGEIAGDEIQVACVVTPPGGAQYKMLAPKSMARGLGGPVVAMASAKAARTAHGDAGEVPRKMCVLALSDTTLYVMKKKTFGAMPEELLASWPRTSVHLSAEGVGEWPYPALGLSFTDGTSCLVFSENDVLYDLAGENLN